MKWDTGTAWSPRIEGERPVTLRERYLAVKLAVLDLPDTLRQDQSSEMAAGMTFFLLFSLFPGLVFLVTLLPVLPREMTNLQLLFDVIRPILPGEVYSLLHEHFTALVTKPRKGVALVSAGIALFSASRALVSLSRALNRIYRVETIKAEWLRRLRSMGLTGAVLLTLLLAVLALTTGDWIVGLLVRWDLLPLGKGTAIAIVRWPLLFTLASFLVQQLYYLLPDSRPRWRPFTTGAAFAVLGIVSATFVLRWSTKLLVTDNVAYGSLGSVAVVMGWLYLGCLALIVGATFNALTDRGLPPSERAYGPRSTDAPHGEHDAD